VFQKKLTPFLFLRLLVFCWPILNIGPYIYIYIYIYIYTNTATKEICNKTRISIQILY